MPVYCFQDRQGFIHEKVFPIGKAPREINLGARGSARRCFSAESKGVPPKKGWPMECIASGVNAEQGKELADHLKKNGVPTEVTPDGNPVYRDKKHRDKALKVRGMHDRSSYN